MSSPLGHLAWWTIPNAVTIERGALTEALREFDLTPPPVLPIDTFRRVSSSSTTQYELDGAVVTLDLRKATGQSTMLVRHVVRTVRRDGIVQKAHRVGDFVFYKPPRGEPHRARVRATPTPNAEISTDERDRVVAFLNEVRRFYTETLDTVDAQALRRLVRAFLKANHALHLDGPYFLREESHADQLSALLDRVEGCHLWRVTAHDDATTRQALTDAFLASDPTEFTLPLLEAYAPLDVVPESVWKAFEEAPHA